MSVEFLEIPPERLDTTTLEGLVEAFINREGTDYGLVERDFGSKVADVLGQIRKGQVVICYDPRSETCNLLSRDEFRRYQLENS